MHCQTHAEKNVVVSMNLGQICAVFISYNGIASEIKCTLSGGCGVALGMGLTEHDAIFT